MASIPTTIEIFFDIESIVKVICLNKRCKFNMLKSATCELKHIVIDDKGVCREFEPRQEALGGD